MDFGHRPQRPLTRRQKEVIDLFLIGFTNAEIANELGISVNTVRYHVNGLMNRFRAISRTHLAALMTEWRMNDADEWAPNR